MLGLCLPSPLSGMPPPPHSEPRWEAELHLLQGDGTSTSTASLFITTPSRPPPTRSEIKACDLSWTTSCLAWVWILPLPQVQNSFWRGQQHPGLRCKVSGVSILVLDTQGPTVLMGLRALVVPALKETPCIVPMHSFSPSFSRTTLPCPFTSTVVPLAPKITATLKLLSYLL